MPTEIEIQITPLFSTPLLVFTPAHHERINAELSQLILAREASVPRHRSDPVVLASRPVDDDEIFLEFIKNALEKKDYEVSTADNGEDGLNKFNKNSYNLVITDIYMPVMDGVQFFNNSLAWYSWRFML